MTMRRCGAVVLLNNRNLLRSLIVVFGVMSTPGVRTAADEPPLARSIGDTTYQLKLEFEDDFDTLDNWLVETTGTVTVDDRWLLWDCYSSGKQAGTIWCKKRFSGPTVVEFDAAATAGARNLNFILYATHPQGLLETTDSRTGDYGDYHKFPNYIVTYLTPRVDGEENVFSENQWRIRFRKNPGFHLLCERMVESPQSAGRRQRLTYVMDGQGGLKLFVDGELLQEYEDRSSLDRSGYHAFRTWNSDVRYANFKVYSILDE